MSEQRIDDLINIPAIEAQFKTVQGYLDNLSLQLKNFQVIPTGTNAANIQQLTNLNNAYSQSLQSVSTVSSDVVNSQAKLVQMQQQLTVATQQNTASLKDNIQTRIRVKNSIDSYLQSQKEDLLLLKAGTITRDEYNKRLIDSNVKVEQYKNQLLVLNKEIKTQTLTTAQQGGAYAVLNKEYQAAQLNAKNLAVIYGIESKEARVAAATALALNKELQAIDKTVGLSQRNVGNYGNVFQKAFSGLRTLANILPGIGISGLVLFAIEPISKWIDKLKEGAGQLRILNKVFEDAGKSSGGTIAKLEILRTVITDLNEPMKKRLDALKEYNSTADAGNKIDEKQIDNIDLVNKGITSQIVLIRQRAIAKAFENQLGEAAEELVSAQVKQQLQAFKLTQDLAKAERALSAARDSDHYLDIQNQRDAIKQKRDNNNQEVKDAQKKFDDLLKLSQNFVNLDVLTDPGKTKTGGKDSVKSISDDTAKAILQALFNVNKRALELEQDRAREIALSDKHLFSTRLSALNDFVIASQALVDLETQYEISSEALRLNEVVKSLEKEKKEKGANVRALNSQIEKERKASVLRIADIEDKGRVDQIKQLLAFQKLKEDIEKDGERKITKIAIDGIKEKAAATSAWLQKIYDDQYNQQVELGKKQKQANKDLLKELQTTFFAFLQDNLTREEQVLDERQRLLGEDKDKQIRQVELLGLTEVERTRRIAEIEKEAAFQNEQIEKRKRDLAVQRAKFEKAQSIASIIQSTAQAVVAALGNKPYSPANIALAATVGAIGALQLARAISTPLPKYAKGTDSAAPGLAWAGEIGTELVTERSGKQYLTPGIPTLMHFKGGEKITPANLTADILNAANMKSLATIQPKQSYSQNDINSHLLQDAVQQLKYLNRKPGISIHNHPAVETTPWYQNIIRG